MEKTPTALKILDTVTVILLLAATGMVFFYAPLEAVMGQVQRVFYFHVAAGWVGMLGFLVAAVVGGIYLKTGDRKWDIARLTTATIMELIYAAYLMLRSGIEDPDRRARFGAVYAIIGFISVPLTFFSARLFRTIHPVVIGTNQPGAEGAFDMTPRMLQTFLFSLLTFSFIFGSLLWHRIRLGRLADKVEQLKMKSYA